MIDYKLAKDLRDIGFPQLEKGNGRFICKCDDWVISSCKCQPYYIPTLSELIAAIGKITFIFFLTGSIGSFVLTWTRATTQYF